jgi:hypothetical protein
MLLPARDPILHGEQKRGWLGFKQLDFIGAALSLSFITCLLLALQWGEFPLAPSWGPWLTDRRQQLRLGQLAHHPPLHSRWCSRYCVLPVGVEDRPTRAHAPFTPQEPDAIGINGGDVHDDDGDARRYLPAPAFLPSCKLATY